MTKLPYLHEMGKYIVSVECLNDIIEEACELIEERLKKEGIVLVKNLQIDIPNICEDLEAIYTCILNLLTNAIEAFPASKTDKRIEISTKLLSHEQVCVDVIDNGKGISEEIRKQIFPPYLLQKAHTEQGWDLPLRRKL